jgi:NAD(P)H-hydrate epimerase
MLASRAAGRAGAGIVLLATSRGVIATVASAIPEVAFIPLPETESSSGARRAVEQIGEHAGKSTAMVVGPGLGADDASDNLLGTLFGFGGKSETVRGRMGFGGDGPTDHPADVAASTFLAEHNLNVVVDADGLNWLARQDNWWENMPAQRLVLTPHPGEMARLLDRPVEEVTADPAAIVTEAANKWQQTVVLKGGHTVVSNGETTYRSALVAPSLATAGSGDVLAGTIGGLLAQVGSPLEAAALALFLGPRAALRVEERFGVFGVIATDLPDAIATEMAVLAGRGER